MARTLFIVLGPPRSGTSTLSRAMRVFGAEHGADLLVPHPTNPKGFWEPAEVMAIDDALLSASRSRWYRVGLELDRNAANYPDLQKRAAQFLNDSAARYGRFAIKEPRMARLMGFWKPLIEETGWDCRYIIALRNPISVAASLHQSHGIDTVQAALLWAEYLMNAIRYTSADNRIILDYDRLLANPEAVLRAAGEALGEPNCDPKEMRDFCDSFLASELRHSTHDLNEVFASPDIPAPVAIFYSQLLRCASDKLPLDSQEIETSIAKLEHLWREFAPIWQWLARLDDETNRLSAEIISRDDRLITLSANSTAAGIEIAELRRLLAIQEREIDQLSQHLAVRDGNIDELRQLLAARDGHIAGLTAWLAGREAELANREQIIFERDAWISTLTSSNSWKLTQPLRWLRARLSKRRSI